MILIAPVLEVQERHLATRELRTALEDLHEPPGVVEGKRPQQCGVDETEDGRRCADAQGEDEHGRERETGRLARQTNGAAKILGEDCHGPWTERTLRRLVFRTGIR